jgi:hypothetical protein
VQGSPAGIDDLIVRMESLLEPLIRQKDAKRFFLATYVQTTRAVKDEIARQGFVDPEWMTRWDLVFADRYLQALEQWNRGEAPPGPWRVAFEATSEALIPLRHVLLGINAHVNYDLPQALLEVISDQEFDDPALIARRSADHLHMDHVLASRVADLDRDLRKETEPGALTWLDRALTPLNRLGTKRFLKESRRKVWHNAAMLSLSRRRGPESLAAKVRELEALSAARVADLRAPGQVILKLAVRGFGVELSS